MAIQITLLPDPSAESQDYNVQDVNLISSSEISTTLTTSSYIESHIYDLDQSLITSNYNFTNYSVLNNGQSAGTSNAISQIELNVEESFLDPLFDTGEYIATYNFLNKHIGSQLENLYISEISSDRTEIRLDSTILDNASIIEQSKNFIFQREESDYFFDFYLNFGDNNLFIANNFVLDDKDFLNPTILVKLYEPLPEDYDINSTLWIVSEIEPSTSYQVSFIEDPIEITDTIPIKGPNFNLDLKDQVNNSTTELSYNDITLTSLLSSNAQLNSLLEEKEIDINVDYTDFNDFIHFSSAQTRLENFYYKVDLIEQYSSSINLINLGIVGPSSASLTVSESKTILEAKINDIITNFDGYDYYLYYSSGSWAWPKSTTEPPYALYPIGSTQVINWYENIILSASKYDNQNKDNLYYSIPEYLRDDPENAQYELFVSMVGQHFDNIWIYYKDVSEKYDADNRLESGISKDIVADAIRDFGIKLYQNNFSNQDLYTAFLGLTPDGALFPFPEITGSLPTPTGFEYVDTLISASNDYLPLDDVNKSLYKRIYHNLPYLLKAKGTLPGLRALITSYGIPDTILRINEYGGKDKVNSNDWDYWQNEFNYAFCTAGNNFISSSWELNPLWNSPDDVPSTLMLRFKADKLPETNIPYSQSLWYATDSTGESGSALILTYTGSAYTSGSFSGSIIDPYYQFAHLTFYPNTFNSGINASVYLPFFNEGWWSVMVTRDGDDFSLYTQNKIYEGGNNGTLLGFNASSSITAPLSPWVDANTSYFPVSFSVSGSSGLYDVGFYDVSLYDSFGGSSFICTPFSGCYQEIRYYNSVISEEHFRNYTMNPYSIEGNSILSSPNELAFRATVAGELYQENISVHPKVTGSWPITNSFVNDSTFYYDTTPEYSPNTEYFFYNQPIAGIKNAVSDKIRLENDSIPSGSVLSAFRSLSQTTEASASYTPNINYLEVAFSPQNEINEDIMDQLGFFNMGDYIGNPLERFSGNSYPDLDKLRNDYFEKYTQNYNLVDFIRLIKFFDNSLFKMIKDFVPARTSLASGVIIKQHLLERNKYPQPQVSWEDLDISGTLKPQWNGYEPGTVENFSGGTAGSFEIFNGINTSPYGADGNGPDNIFGITQSWSESISTPLGIVTMIHDTQDEFYDGEFSGSILIVTTQSLNQPYPNTPQAYNYKQVHYYGLTKSEQSDFLNLFLNPLTIPQPGEVLFFNKSTGIPPIYSPVNFDTQYLKISKIDCDGIDHSIPLGEVTQIYVYNPVLSNYTPYTITNINELSGCYLYEASQFESYTPTDFPNQVLDYFTSASNIPGSQPVTPNSVETIINSYGSTGGNILGYFDSSQGIYTFDNTPNTLISITGSTTISGSSGKFSISLERQGNFINLTSANYTSEIPLTISSSYYGLQGDQLYLSVTSPNPTFLAVRIKSGSLLITQSRAVSSSTCEPVIFEPYITTPNFYNSDENAILNNAFDDRLSTFYQDVDYSTGILTPTNFALLISGSADKAAVQDSNYTTARHILPRYNGCKSTSQQLNVWSSTDQGTYGKLPTVESLKTYIAYSDTIGGYAPEKMNTSGVFVKYFISEDGDLITPNTNPDALSINQQTFVSGENVIIESLGAGFVSTPQIKTLFRGGSSIVPILTNQIRHYDNPPMEFTGSINFTDDNPNIATTVNDYTATLQPDAITTVPSVGVWVGINMGNVVVTGSNLSGTSAVADANKYEITTGVINENIDLIFNVKVTFRYFPADPLNAPLQTTAYARLVSDTGYVSNAFYVGNGGFINRGQLGVAQFSITLPHSQLILGDKFQVSVMVGHPEVQIIDTFSYFKISQNPLPTPPVDAFCWQSSSVAGYENVIYTTSSALLQYYNNPLTHQKDISGSGFFPITLPFTIEKGDEFRFEGDESKAFMVEDVTLYSASIFLPNTSVLSVSLNGVISGSNININEYLLRRYIDNSSGLVLNGLKPPGFDGPYLIKPQYVSTKMKENIGKYIEDLTQKGLL